MDDVNQIGLDTGKASDYGRSPPTVFIGPTGVGKTGLASALLLFSS